MKAIFCIFAEVKFQLQRNQGNENEQGTRGKNTHSIIGGTAFYSGVGPGARIFIGAPFLWDRVRADDECVGVGAPPIRGCGSPDDDLPDVQFGAFWRGPRRVIRWADAIGGTQVAGDSIA